MPLLWNIGTSRRIRTSFLLSLILTACRPNPLNETDIAQIKMEAALIIEKYTIPNGLKARNIELHNAAIIRIGVKQIQLHAEGVYFMTSDFLVEERGYFVPRKGEQKFSPHTDPSYELLAPGLFYYRIRG